ncbi:hypothetical protein Pth03_65740 [Planotetraspora thailandica]|uniref:Uncharacterized protein n=1 Tax=Planotetraspora thailandica TaxID=487172 RepID=A0A8J4DDG1_9ACTN|nr:hypothetical protein Pth03_65740 [Planotetraspora thailandica]
MGVGDTNGEAPIVAACGCLTGWSPEEHAAPAIATPTASVKPVTARIPQHLPMKGARRSDRPRSHALMP